MSKRFTSPAAAVAFVVGFSFVPLNAQPASSAFDIDTETSKIANFRIGYPEIKTFGKLEYFGGFEITSNSRDFGALSGMSLIENRSRIVAIADTGFWFTAKVLRDDEGRPIGLSQGKMAPILDKNGKPFTEKWYADAESITISGKYAYVSFERDNRIARYPLDLDKFAGRPKPVLHRIPKFELRRNKGLEAFAISPQSSPLKGASVVISERSLDKQGNIFGAINNGPKRGVFKVRRNDEFDITDADFLPNGDLLLLERKFRMSQGVAMRIRRFMAKSIKPGAMLEGEVWIKANMAFQIDNMEGLSVTTGDGGKTYLSLISDDNHSIFQRTLYLEFKLAE